MAITPPPPDEGRPYRRAATPSKRPPVALLGWLAVIPVLLLVGMGYYWFVQRVEVPAGKVLVLVRKVGEPLPSTMPDGSPVPETVRTQTVLYPALLEALGESPDSTRYKGIQYEVLPEGRYFYDPLFWERQVHPAVVIGQDEIGVRVRLYGQPLPPGKIVATEEHERGPLKDVLMPERYNINPYAYQVRRVKPVIVKPGFVGVQRLLHGTEPDNPNDWTVQPGERGVQPNVLPAGTYYNNPFVRQITPIDVRSKTLDLRQDEAIRFPSADSFEIIVEATVEYAISQDMAPYVMVAIGEHEDIEKKLILPYARSLSRIEGSKLLAKEFISGETRLRFQNAFFDGLRDQCAKQGIEVRAALIRRIEPPAAIADPISERQLADQQINKYRNDQRVAQAEAELVKEQEMQSQNKLMGEADREVVTLVKAAEQRKAVALTEAQKRLEVARLNLEAAKEQAAAKTARGEAEADVITLNYKAEAEPLADAIRAFGGGETYAQYFFYQQLAPALRSVLASTDGPFAEIFTSLSRSVPTEPPATTQGETP